jgi:hypothetical protein
MTVFAVDPLAEVEREICGMKTTLEVRTQKADPSLRS